MFSIGGITIFYISPSVFAVLIFSIIINSHKIYLITFTSAIMHEIGHLVVAKLYGYSIEKVTLMPIGINGKIKEQITDKTHNFFISLAGPLVNLLIALVASHYRYNNVVACNIYLLIFNLLPILPLDGGRIFSSFYDNKKLNQTIRFLTYAVFILTLLFDFVKNGTLNVSLIFILFFTLSGDNGYLLNDNKTTETKIVQGNKTVLELLKNKNCIFLVYDGNAIIGILNYDDVYNAAMKGLYYLNTKDLITERIKNGYPQVR